MTLPTCLAHGRSAMAVLLMLAGLGMLTSCQDGSQDDDHPAGSAPSATGEPVGRVQAPPSSVTKAECEKTTSGDRSATSGEVIAGPFDGLAGAARKTGVAKLWVAPATKTPDGEDAVIQVDVIEGPVQADSSVYVRSSENMVTVTPAPENGVNKIYNGTIVVPSAPGTTIRITVTIGDATGCFLTRL